MTSYANYNLILILAVCVTGYKTSKCNVRARTESGWVCGMQREDADGVPYASFRKIPYAKQPLGELRFKELQPPEPWDHILDATTEGPSCYQHNIYLGPLLQPKGYSESCIFANIHIPLHALPSPNEDIKDTGGLPIFVFYHGGGWISGSGDSDMNGPELLVAKDVIVVTFNYRLDVLGFLSLGTSKIPGNNGIRDCVTLLRWVQRNARYFGGDPDNVTLAGQSAGSSNAHLLSLSPISKGLFNRLWLMSGTAIPRNHATAPAYANYIATKFLTILGLNGTDYDTVHDKLVQMPIDVIHSASRALLPLGVTTFLPVQESPLPGVTPIITDNPEKLLANGNGDDIPTVIGFNNNEGYAFQPILEKLDVLSQHQNNPLLVLPPQIVFSLPDNEKADIANKLADKYFGVTPTLDECVQLCGDSFFAVPTLQFVRDRNARGGAPLYLYKFTYDADHSVIKKTLNLSYPGATHIDDMTNILQTNSITVPASPADDDMRDWMAGFAANFAKTGSPSLDDSWLPESSDEEIRYLHITSPYEYMYTEISCEDKDLLRFYDNLYDPYYEKLQ